MTTEERKKRREQLRTNSDITLRNMQKIADESSRVADVAYNSQELIADLEREFESATGLQGNDIVFLFAATALQLARVVILNELTKVEHAGSKNRNETKLHEFQQKLLGRFQTGALAPEEPYYASMEHIITKMGVPYDATATLTEESIVKLVGRGETWDVANLSELIPTDKLNLFKGANHRFSTLGHDPILGLIFGTGNIMTNTITCVKTPLLAGGIPIPVLTTNHVVFTSDYTHPRIATYASTGAMLNHAIQRTKEEPGAFAASLIKQLIHIGTDMYTPCGIQIPAANLILSNTATEKLTKYIGVGDVLKVGTAAGLAMLINTLISTLHMLMYDSTSAYSRDVYQVRTRKIIMYSNAIVSASNLIWVGANMIAGNEGAIKQLDLGGLLVTVHRLIHDTEYIRQIKNEFVLGGFNKMIQGSDLELEETIWD